MPSSNASSAPRVWTSTTATLTSTRCRSVVRSAGYEGRVHRSLAWRDLLPRPAADRPARYRHGLGGTACGPGLLRLRWALRTHRSRREAQRSVSDPPQARPEHPGEPAGSPRRRPLLGGLGLTGLRHGTRRGEAYGAGLARARRRRQAPAWQVSPVRVDEDRREPGHLHPAGARRLVGSSRRSGEPGATDGRPPGTPVGAALPGPGGARRGGREGSPSCALGSFAARQAAVALRRDHAGRDEGASGGGDGEGVAEQPGDGWTERRGSREASRRIAEKAPRRAGSRAFVSLSRGPGRLPGRRAPGGRDDDGRAVFGGGGPERVARRLWLRPRRGLDVRSIVLPAQRHGGSWPRFQAYPARASHAGIRGGGPVEAPFEKVARRARNLPGLSSVDVRRDG